MEDRLARMGALLMQHLSIRPHVPPTPRPPPSPTTTRYGPQRDDIRESVYVVDTRNLTTDKSPSNPYSSSHSAYLAYHQPRHWTDPRRELPEGRLQLLDNHEEFMSQLMPPLQPPPQPRIGHYNMKCRWFPGFSSSSDCIVNNAVYGNHYFGMNMQSLKATMSAPRLLMWSNLKCRGGTTLVGTLAVDIIVELAHRIFHLVMLGERKLVPNNIYHV
ncbi:hypothetical protein Scep_027496 [Stephania cephalantha]|uniref:Uncharacterized protein n=1 Tax=Stephania cephalantha TaxID=152367 RepID=A0AAP0E874_9MAGN